MEMDLNNRLTEDETLEQAYDIFLELAVDNLDPADVILFNLLERFIFCQAVVQVHFHVWFHLLNTICATFYSNGLKK